MTVRTVKKKQKQKSRGAVRTVTKTVQVDSFFNFFNPPRIPEDASDVDEDTQALLTSDYEIGYYIRERIVPKAVLYYTGESIFLHFLSFFILRKGCAINHHFVQQYFLINQKIGLFSRANTYNLSSYSNDQSMHIRKKRKISGNLMLSGNTRCIGHGSGNSERVKNFSTTCKSETFNLIHFICWFVKSIECQFINAEKKRFFH